LCHDAMLNHGPIGRYRVKEVVCKECNTRQKRSYVVSLFDVFAI